MRIEARKARWFRPLIGNEMVHDLAILIAKHRLYHAIYADPPWKWTRAGGKKGSSESYYPTMPLDELCALRVAEVAHPNCFLFLWVPPAGLVTEGLPLMQAWGFTYKTAAVWDKATGGYGIGSYWRTEHEMILLGVRKGTQTHFDDDTLSSMIRFPRSRNSSEKPIAVNHMIEKTISPPWLELFARRHVTGWDCYGNQLAPLVGLDDRDQLNAAD